MTRDDILRMAREVGLYVGTNLSGVMLVGHAKHDGLLIHLDADDLARFAALVAAAEREACAKVCEALFSPSRLSDPGRSWITGTIDCAAAIRQRGA